MARYRNDNNDVAQGFNSLTQALGNVQAIGRNKELMDQEREDRQKKKQLESDTEMNLKIMNTPEFGGEAYSVPGGAGAMGGTEKSKLAAKKLYTEGLQADQTAQEIEDAKQIDQRVEQQWAYLQEDPDRTIDAMKPELMAGRIGLAAFGKLSARLASDTANAKSMMENRMAIHGRNYKLFEASKNYIAENLKNGKIEEAAEEIIRASKKLPIRYQLEDFNPETKEFSMRYLDRKTGEFKETKRVKLEEAVGMINKMGLRQYAQGAIINAEAVRVGNEEAFKNPIPAKGTNGKRYFLVPQINPNDANSVQVVAFDEKTGEPVKFPSWKAVAEYGIFAEDVKRENDLKRGAHIDQQIETSKEQAKSYTTKKENALIDRANKATKAKREELTKTMTAAAKFFGKSGIDWTNPEAMFSSAGESAYAEAAKFYHDNKSKPNTLAGQDKEKYFAARALVAAGREFFGAPVETQGKPAEKKTYTVEEATTMGAKQLPDGRWVIKSDIPGKSKLIQVEDPEDAAPMYDAPEPEPELYGPRNGPVIPVAKQEDDKRMRAMGGLI